MGKIIAGIALCLPLVVAVIVRIVIGYYFDIGCGGHLLRASNASSIDIARTELQTAMEYAERHDMTSGNTRVIFKTPANDVGYWYNNINAALAELDSAEADSTQTATTNTLIKLRETLTDQGQNGAVLAIPGSISVFPYNAGWLLVWWLTGLAATGGAILMMAGSTEM